LGERAYLLHALLSRRALALVALLACACASSGKQPVAQVAPAAGDEASLMAKIRADLQSAPAAALAGTEEGEHRYGDSALAEERRALAIQALINLDRIGAARSRAYQFLERYPSGPYSAHVVAMTGVHVAPTGPADRTSSP
jgi:hypothetical protein